MPQKCLCGILRNDIKRLPAAGDGSVGAFFLTSKSQLQPAVIQTAHSTLPQKHPNRSLNLPTSKWPTQPSDQSD